MDIAWTLWLIGLYSKVSDFVINAFGTFNEILHAIFSVFNPKMFYLFKNMTGAYFIEDFQPWASGSARPEWIYHAGKHVWYPWNGHITTTLEPNVYTNGTLPILSLEIVEGATAHYDLTDFLEQMRVIKTVPEEAPMPSVGHLVNVWAATSHIVVDRERFKARLIDADGNTHDTILNDWRDLKEVVATAENAVEEEISGDEKDD
jgi:hypothetical protein